MIPFIIGAVASVFLSELSKTQRMGKGGSVLLAPNGKPSKLTPEQWHLVRTPEFKAWFGDWENDPENASKVVDENGEPLVVYRGMPKNRKFGNIFRGNIKLFNNRQTNKFGFFFSRNKEEADLYGMQSDEEFVVKSYFLNVRKILFIDKKDSVASNVKRNIKSMYPNSFTLYEKPIPELDKILGKAYLTFKELFDLTKPSKNDFEILNKSYESDNWTKIQKTARQEYDKDQTRKNAKQVFTHFIDIDKNDQKQEFWKNYIHNIKKYDGLVFYEDTFALQFIGKKEKPIVEFMDYPNTYCVFEPNQIKLADGTNTTFDPENPDIRYKDGGEVNYGHPKVDMSDIPLIHETAKETAEIIIKNGFIVGKYPYNTNGIYTIPLPLKPESFGSKNDVELAIYLKPKSKIFWTGSKYPSDYYVGYGNKYFQNLYKKLNKKWEWSLKNQNLYFGSRYQANFNRNMEKWLSDNGYCGIQQGGEIVITDLSCIESIESIQRYKKGGFFRSDSATGGNLFVVYFDLNGKRKKMSFNVSTETTAKNSLKYIYPEATNIQVKKVY